jgi:hypothetical protein
MNSSTQEQQVFAKHGIEPSELRWTGRPRMGLLSRRQDLLRIPESLLLVTFVVLTALALLRPGGPDLAVYYWVPVALAVSYMVVGRFMWDAYRRSVTYYGLTSDSALILQLHGLGGGVQRLYLPAVAAISFHPSSDGSGTIAFGDPNFPYRPAWDWYGGPSVPSFEGIPNARHVYDLCEAARRGEASDALQAV